jgi:hypothetical protein
MMNSPATARVLITGIVWIIAGASLLFMLWHYKHIVSACFFNEDRHGQSLDKDGDGSVDLKERCAPRTVTPPPLRSSPHPP